MNFLGLNPGPGYVDVNAGKQRSTCTRVLSGEAQGTTIQKNLSTLNKGAKLGWVV